MSSRRDVVVLGSTGSIGTQALDVVRANPDLFRVVALTAGGSNPGLFRAAVRGVPAPFSGLGEEASSRRRWPVTWCSTASPARSACTHPGRARRRQHPRWRTRSDHRRPGGRRGPSPARSSQSTASTARSRECLRDGRADEVRRLVLTAGGGPFRGRSRADASPRAGVRPHLEHGPVVRGQQRDPGQQGPRGDRGAPCSSASPSTGLPWSYTDLGGALDGRSSTTGPPSHRPSRRA